MQSKFARLTGLVVLFILSTGYLNAQRDPMRFGRINQEDLEMTRFEADTSAKAVILGDYGVVEIRYHASDGFQYHFTRHQRIKILHRDAFDLGDFNISLHSSRGQSERLSNLKANVFNMENGRMQRTSFSRRDAFEEEVSEYLKYVNFALPNIKEGSVIEVEYTIVSPFLFTLPTWFFQYVHPTVFSEFRIYAPEYFYYKPLMQGFLTLNQHSTTSRSRNFDVEWEEELAMGRRRKHKMRVDYQENFHLFRIENAPAFTLEPHMNAPINYVSKIEHELVHFRWPYGPMRDFSSTWEQLTTRLLESESFGRLLNRSGFLSEEAKQIASTYQEPHERMVAAFELVQSHMNWNQRNGIYAGRSLRRAWNDQQGNVADINLALVLLLRELDIQADPVILSTRAHGIINPAQIMLDKFNYVVAIASIDGENYLLDATNKHNPWYLLPERCLNGQGRLIVAGRGRWVNLEAVADNITHTRSHIIISPCGGIEVNMEREKARYDRARMEARYRSYNKVEDFMDAFEASNQGADLKDFQLANQGDWSQPLVSTYHFEIPSLDGTPSDVLYVQPLLNDAYTSNPFRLETRQFPVDFVFPFKRTYEITIQVPEGYTIDEMPRNSRFSLARRAGSYNCTYARTDDGNVTVTIEMDIRKALFLADEYQDLRNFFARIVEEQARTVVLKKL